MLVAPTSLALRPPATSHRSSAGPLAPPTRTTSSKRSDAATPEAATRVTLELEVAVELGLRVKMETVTRDSADSSPPVEEKADEAYEAGEETAVEADGEAAGLPNLAHRLIRAVDRAIHDAMKPLVRGRNGLDHESRAQLREMRRELRHTIRDGFEESLDGEDFALSTFASRTVEALESFAGGFGSPSDGSSEEEPRSARPERLQQAVERMSDVLEHMIESLRPLMAAPETEDEEDTTRPDPVTPEKPEIRLPLETTSLLSGRIDLSV